MRTVVWHLPPEYGHFAPAQLLARQLVDYGYRVVFLSERDMQSHVEKAGFEYGAYLADVYPLGSLPARDLLSADDTWKWWLGRDLAMWQEASSGRLEAVLASLAPDLVVADQLNPDTSLVAHKLKIPVVRASAMLPSSYAAGVPPMWSDALPGELSAWELEVEWMCHEALLWRQPWNRGDKRFTRRAFYEFVENCGLHVAQINLRSAFNYHVESDPEIVLCSQAFDFPSPEVPDRVYMGPCLAPVDAEPWTYPTRRPGAPLIYCAFGSKGSSYPTAERVIERLLETAAARPELDIVIAIPDEMIRGRDLPPSVYTLAWAPQREVLEQASVVITHAGINSCREAIWAGVPMLAIPQAHDQRGLAARIVYHGLGERLLDEMPSTAEFIATLDRIRLDPKYKQAAERMSARFRADQRDDVGLRFVVDLTERRIQPKTPAYYEGITRRLYRSIMGDE